MKSRILPIIVALIALTLTACDGFFNPSKPSEDEQPAYTDYSIRVAVPSEMATICDVVLKINNDSILKTFSANDTVYRQEDTINVYPQKRQYILHVTMHNEGVDENKNYCVGCEYYYNYKTYNAKEKMIAERKGTNSRRVTDYKGQDLVNFIADNFPLEVVTVNITGFEK